MKDLLLEYDFWLYSNGKDDYSENTKVIAQDYIDRNCKTQKEINMSSNCYNQITIEGSDKEIRDVLSYVKSKESDFDFEKVISIPKCFKDIDETGYSMFCEDIAKYIRTGAIKDWLARVSEREKKTVDELVVEWEETGEYDIKLGLRILDNREEYDGCGYPSNFCSKYWGTKWNAMDIEIEGNSISLITANGSCSPVLMELSRIFPKVIIEHSFEIPDYDESGWLKYKDGEILNTDLC